MKPSAENLNSNDVFVLKTPDSVFLWKGVGATDGEVNAAKHICSFLGGSITEVAEGKEPGDHSPTSTFKTSAFKIYLMNIFLYLKYIGWFIKSSCVKVSLNIMFMGGNIIY